MFDGAPILEVFLWAGALGLLYVVLVSAWRSVRRRLPGASHTRRRRDDWRANGSRQVGEEYLQRQLDSLVRIEQGLNSLSERVRRLEDGDCVLAKQLACSQEFIARLERILVAQETKGGEGQLAASLLQGEVAGQQTRIGLPSIAREFLELCDRSSVTAEEARAWFHSRDVQVDVLVGEGSDWALLQLWRDREGAVVPAIRRPMGQVPLKDYFELSGYDGLDLLRPDQVTNFAELTRTERGWTVSRRGAITVRH